MVMTDKIKEEVMDRMACEYCRKMESNTEPKTRKERYWKEFHRRLINKQNSL